MDSLDYQFLPVLIADMHVLLTLNFLAISVCAIPVDSMVLIWSTSALVSLLTLLNSPFRVFFDSPVRKACAVFSLAVHHSKFSILLSLLTPFIWLINGFRSGFSIKADAISRWATILRLFPFSKTASSKYPLLDFSVVKYLYPLCVTLLNRYSLLTSYKYGPSTQSIFSHTSSMFTLINKNTSYHPTRMCQ